MTTCVAVLALIGLGSAAAPAAQGTLALCGNSGTAPGPIRHVLVVMMENLSYRQVVGNTNAPFQTSLAKQCGVATAEFAATHTSGANYLAVSAGQYPPSSPPGCGGIKQCADASNNLYNQLGSAGLTWAGYEEAMPTPCDPSSSGPVANGHNEYSVGHNPVVFYTDITHAACVANDLPVADLTAQSGAFWTAAKNQTLPAFSFLTPSAANDNEGGKTKALGEQIGDAWLQRFVATLQQSASYQSGNTLLLIAYDEGEGGDFAVGENCTNMSLDLPVTNGISAHQDSCHVPLFVVYPYTPAGDADPAFFDHYSITRTVEDLFGLPHLAHAGDGQTASLVGHFGILSATAGPPPAVAIGQPADGSAVSGQVTVSGTASDDSGIAQVTVSVDGGTPHVATGTGDWSTGIDTTSLANGQHTITAQARANDG
ncbi:MAG TPA: alkaline phosphatase family protein, partial [Gaiellales bacterium]|nr:alkaline phosphatase family protein [Gaiellales bacterium]